MKASKRKHFSSLTLWNNRVFFSIGALLHILKKTFLHYIHTWESEILQELKKIHKPARLLKSKELEQFKLKLNSTLMWWSSYWSATKDIIRSLRKYLLVLPRWAKLGESLARAQHKVFYITVSEGWAPPCWKVCFFYAPRMNFCGAMNPAFPLDYQFLQTMTEMFWKTKMSLHHKVKHKSGIL